MPNARHRVARRVGVTIVVAFAVAGLLAFPAFSADTGTVSAQVVAGVAPCITITSPPSGGAVDFGALPFSTNANPPRASGTPGITAANCGTSSETFLARGTNATGPNALWSLDAQPIACPGPVDAYNLILNANNNDVFLDDVLSQTLGTVQPNTSTSRTPKIVMPCSGSSGNGATMTMSYIFTATIP